MKCYLITDNKAISKLLFCSSGDRWQKKPDLNNLKSYSEDDITKGQKAGGNLKMGSMPSSVARRPRLDISTVNAASNDDIGKANNAMLPNRSSKRRNTFKEFCAETNLNGWYFMSKKNTCSRIFWSLVIIISIALAFIFTFIIISEFFEANIMITIDSVTPNLDKVVFPSIIVCNQNKVSFHKIIFWDENMLS